MQKFICTGNLTRDPELTTTSTGKRVCRFTVAVTRPYAGSDGERKTDFFNVTAWNDLAERIALYQKKGNKVLVCGTLQMREYEDNEGVKKTTVDVIAQEVEFLTPKKDEEVRDLPKNSDMGGTSKKKPKLEQASFDDMDIPF